MASPILLIRLDICHETVRFWWNRFGPMFATAIRKRRVQNRSYSTWRWHLDEVFVRINGETHYLWRAVDHEGEVLEVFAELGVVFLLFTLGLEFSWPRMVAMRREVFGLGTAQVVLTTGLVSAVAVAAGVDWPVRICGSAPATLK